MLKIVSPKVRATPDTPIAVEATDQGGGVSAPQIFNNGARLAVAPTAKREGGVVRYSFPVNLGAGNNQLRVTAASDDGSWEAIPVEIELNYTKRSARKGRLFVVALGAGEKPSMGFALRAAVERWSRAQGIRAIAAYVSEPPKAVGATTPGLLASLLLEAAGSGSGATSTASAGRDANNAIGVMDWFNAAADRAGAVIQRPGLDPQVVQASSRPKGFLLLAATR